MGRINSVQTLGTVDGPGIRYVVFFQGCPLRCSCCHNPETWDFEGGREMSAHEIFTDLIRYKNYFGEEGGITLSGGEPLMQAEFAAEIFELCRKEGIHTCLDTGGCLLDGGVKKLLDLTDLVLLDIKYTKEEDYSKYVKGSYGKTLEFLNYLEAVGIGTWIRQVVIPGINEGEENLRRIETLEKANSCVKKVEFLPFKKLCIEKYDELGLEFPFKDIPEN